MILLNPITIDTNIDTLCDEVGMTPSVRLMEYRINDVLNRTLQSHQVSLKLKAHDLSFGFNGKDCFFVVENGITVVCVGSSASFEKDDWSSLMKDFSERYEGEALFFPEEAKEVPGGESLHDALIEAEGVDASCLPWDEIKANFKNGNKDS